MLALNQSEEDKALRTLSSDTGRNEAEMITESEKLYLHYLAELGKYLHGDKINLNDVSDLLDGMERMKKVAEHEYLNTLIRPERTRGSKIPSQMPLPSSSFQLKQSVNITTNAQGNCCVIMNPFFLASSGTNSTFFINNDATLTGSSSSNFFTAVAAGQTIPAVYNQYRLVSASVNAKYTGRLDVVQGLIGGAVVFDQTSTPTTIGTVNANLAKYGDFNLAQDAFFWQEHYSLKGVREIYFPLDNRYEEYTNLGDTKAGFNFLIYVTGAQPSSTIYKLDLYLNMECLPDVTFLNYIPTSINSTPCVDKQIAIRTAQTMAISPADKVEEKVKTPSFMSGLVGKIGSWLPNLAKLTSEVLPAIKTVSSNLFSALGSGGNNFTGVMPYSGPNMLY